MKNLIKNVNGRDYNLVKINTEQSIVLSDGYYDIVTNEDGTTSMTYLGGSGNYFFYAGIKKNIELTQEEIDSFSPIVEGE